jgi:aminoglycoside 2''-phosphotransferase
MSEASYRTEGTPTYTPEQVTVLIHAQFPEIRIETLRFCGEGSSFCSYAVNEEYLFRLGADDESAKRLNWERCLLPQLHPKLSIAVPEFEFIGTLENDSPFVVYRMIQGEPFTAEVYERLPPTAKQRVVKQISDFLKVLHTFPVDKAAACGVREKSMRRSCQEFREHARRVIYPSLSAQEMTKCESWFERYFGDPTYHTYTPALIHGDLQSRHVFFDSENQRIAGVIDFEDIWISDADSELHYLQTEFGEQFGAQLLRQYGHPDLERLRWKSHIFQLCRYIDKIVWGIEDNRPKHLEDGWRDLRAFLGT